jgi:hypothetical protein
MKRKAQQEIIGFVVIMLIIVIAGVLFLRFYLKSGSQVLNDDAEIKNFLESSAKYTSNCYIASESKFKTLEELITDCYSNKICSDRRNSCEVVNETYSEMLNQLWSTGKDSKIGYSGLSFYISQNISDEDSKIPITGLGPLISGNSSYCAMKKTGRDIISNGDQEVVIEFTICRNS